MSKVIVDNIEIDDRKVNIPLSELNHKIIKRYSAEYTGGEWNPTVTYAWVPGMFYDYTPLRVNSKIRTTCMIPIARVSGATHCMSHWIFYANGTELARHSVSGTHAEHWNTLTYEFPSWGTSSGRIGYQMRAYANDNHEMRPYTTEWWEGGGTNQSGGNVKGYFIIEEYYRG